MLSGVHASARQLRLRSRTSQGMSGQSSRYFSFSALRGRSGDAAVFERTQQARGPSPGFADIITHSPVCHPPVSSASSHVPPFILDLLFSAAAAAAAAQWMSLHGRGARGEKHNVAKVGQILHAAHTSLRRIAAFCRGRCAALLFCFVGAVWGLLSPSSSTEELTQAPEPLGALVYLYTLCCCMCCSLLISTFHIYLCQLKCLKCGAELAPLPCTRSSDLNNNKMLELHVLYMFSVP